MVSLLAFEAMAVATAMPVAVRDLDGLPFYAWGFSAFLIASLVGMVVAGEVSDRRGPVQPFVASLVLFVVGLVVAGLATSMAAFVAGRALQGLGAGLNIVSLYVVVGRLYPEAMRPRLFSVMSSAWVIPALVGPSVAGVVADELSWRWVFLAVPPLVLPAVALMLPRLHGLGAAPGAGQVRRRTLPALAVAAGVGVAAVRRPAARPRLARPAAGGGRPPGAGAAAAAAAGDLPGAPRAADGRADARDPGRRRSSGPRPSCR